MTNAQIAQSMNVSVRWIQKPWARHRSHTVQDISHPARTGRPPNGMPGRREHSAVLSVRPSEHLGAASQQDLTRENTGISIPRHTLHGMLKDEEMARDESNGRRKRRWLRWETEYSNSMWHTDWKQIHGGMHDGRRFLCYEDDASRFVTGCGIFGNATAENALKVLDGAMQKHGRPAPMTDHGGRTIWILHPRYVI